MSKPADAGREPLIEAAPAAERGERPPAVGGPKARRGAEPELRSAGGREPLTEARREPLAEAQKMDAQHQPPDGIARHDAPGTPTFVLKLESFEGPLDLLLHLIRSQEIDIRNIPIALVTEQYLGCLELMQELDIDVAAEWLVMAATLVHIKSKLLLPVESGPDESGEDLDPRDELVRRLLEYERFKEAGGALGAREQLGRDIFARTFDAPDLSDPEIAAVGPRPFEPISVSDLLVAFATALANRPRHTVHEIVVERLSLADKITELLDRLSAAESLAFEDLFPREASRGEIVISFLAVLELVRMKVIRAYQAGAFGRIRLESRGGPTGPPPDNLPEPQSLTPAKPGFAPEEPEE